MPEQKNLILAIVISIVILIGFQFMIGEPEEEQPQQATEGLAGDPNEAPALAGAEPAVGSDGATPAAGPSNLEMPRLPGEMAVAPDPRDTALTAEEGERIQVETPRLHGSISLTGGRLDDLTLADYRLTPDPESPEIVLLSPRNAPNPYYTVFGWRAASLDMPTPQADTQWTASGDRLTPQTPVTLTWDNGAGLVFERTISVDDDYMFTVTQRVTNTGEAPQALNPYSRVLRFGTPETLGFFILHEGPYGVFDGTLEEYNYDDLEEDGRIEYQTTGGWLGFTDKYWLVAMVPEQSAAVHAEFTHQMADPTLDLYAATYIGGQVRLAPGESAENTSRVFAGAKEVSLIDSYERTYNIENFDLSIDFGWFYFLTKPFFFALNWINGVVGNFGIAILIFTVAIKLVFFPLANKSYKAMSKMKALQPEMMKLRDRYKEDRQRMNTELMALYKREKVNPASGCLPILIQIPVFFALYKVLFVTIEMRHAPFFGWIQDLSAPDPTSIFNLFGLIPWDPPQLLTIGIWPLIMGATMYLQQKLNPAPTDPMQQRIFMALPFVFTLMLAHFPAGLVIYWAWNNALSILQQWLIMKRMGVPIGGGTIPPGQRSGLSFKDLFGGGGARKSAGASGSKAESKAPAGSAEAEEAEDAPAEAAAPKKKAPAAAKKPAGSAAEGEDAGDAGEASAGTQTGPRQAPPRPKRSQPRQGAARKRSSGGKRKRS
ncbi:MAG: membrane protein insertase YidC [Alphaproteobacteria bacterium]|jgi:YidC/Oxa1 family membrane protein insertase|nr:membrane protein insertase YidC [Alphaproteobacteria bacterium]